MNDEQLTQRIRAASAAMEMSDSAQARHLEAISAALSDADVVPIGTARKSRHRRIVASIVAAAVIAPAGLAAASESSVPGDPLYTVKQLSERVLVLFDTDVIARHRIEEIEALGDLGTSDPSLIESARLALSELGANHPLWQRLEASGAPDETDETSDAVNASSDASPSVADQSDDSGDAPAEPITLIVDLPDGSNAVLTVEDGDIIQLVAPKGWAVSDIDGDHASLEASEFEIDIELRPDGSVRLEVRDFDASEGDEPASLSDDSDSAEDSTSESRSSHDERESDDPTRGSDDDDADDDDASADS